MQVRLRRFGTGDFFGETTLISMEPRPYDAWVDVPTRLLELDNRALYQLYQSDILAYVMVVQNVNRELCRRLRRADLRLTEFADEAHDDATQVGLLVARSPSRRVR
jgi:CRP-like cAMP-binding protein